MAKTGARKAAGKGKEKQKPTRKRAASQHDLRGSRRNGTVKESITSTSEATAILISSDSTNNCSSTERGENVVCIPETPDFRARVNFDEA